MVLYISSIIFLLKNSQHGQARCKRSEYAIRLNKKQNLHFNYGVSERQLVRFMKKARGTGGFHRNQPAPAAREPSRQCLFPSRLGPVVPGARQLLNHGQVTVNDRVTNIASCQCKPGAGICGLSIVSVP